MSPRTPQNFKKIREEKIALIMDVALRHFANDGFYRTTISHIARHAGISKGLMYNYFESKEALLQAIVQNSVNEVSTSLNLDDSAILTREKFEVSLRKFSALLREKRDFWRLAMQLLSQNDVREKLFQVFSQVRLSGDPGEMAGDPIMINLIPRQFTAYFESKKQLRNDAYDPHLESEVFFSTLLGYAVKTIYSDPGTNPVEDLTLNKIIETFK